MRIALVHYHEIALKGRNRSSFERRLESNLAWSVRDIPGVEILRIASRVLVRVHDESQMDSVREALCRTPGVAYVLTGIEIKADSEAIAAAALSTAQDEIANRRGEIRTFAIDARRSFTDYPERSCDINRRLGDIVRIATGLRVDLTNSDLTVRVVVVQGRAFVCAHRSEGPGGLPVGTSGRVVALMSAGIDSPVAAWRIMKRGAVIIGLHFSGRPQTPGHSEHYAAEITRVLSQYGGMGRLYTVAFGDIQRQIALGVPDGLRILSYRRIMMHVAEEVARREDARALVTGESLGQVASQTLENLACVDAAATLPVLRPLIGSDKQEIIAQARRIGTFDLSTGTNDDCCTLFMPKRPQTHARCSDLNDAEAHLDIPGLVAQALDGMTVLDLPSASYRPRRLEA